MSGDACKFEMQLQDFSQEVLKQLNEACDKALYRIGLKGVEGAVNNITTPPNQAVDTGRLRASISFVAHGGGESQNKGAQEADYITGTPDELCTIIGTNVNYAVYVHEGTRKMQARPFLRDGINSVKDDMQEEVIKVFKGEL